MRNYRELTDSEMAELERLYPVTPNRELSRRYGISVDALQDYVAYPRGWKKDSKAVLIGNRGGRSLTEKETQWIVRHYQHTKNDDIMRKFGIGESQLHRVARKYGLSKSRHFMKKVRKSACDTAAEVCKEYGIYERNAEYARKQWEERKARGESLGFKKGESNKTRMSKKRFAETMAKAHATRNETIRKEKMRIRWGRPQRTKMKLVSGGHQRLTHRHLFRKHGYIVDRGSNDVYYDEQTKRSAKMEANAHLYGLNVFPAE